MTEKILPNGTKLEMFDSVDDLPVIRNHKFNEWLMIDSSIGSDMESVERHYTNMMQMLDRGDKELVKKELANTLVNLQYITENVNPKMMAFGCLVHKVNGKEFNDFTELGIKNLLNTLSSHGLSYKLIKFVVDHVKKKYRKKLTSTSLV